MAKRSNAHCFNLYALPSGKIFAMYIPVWTNDRLPVSSFVISVKVILIYYSFSSIRVHTKTLGKEKIEWIKWEIWKELTACYFWNWQRVASNPPPVVSDLFISPCGSRLQLRKQCNCTNSKRHPSWNMKLLIIRRVNLVFSGIRWCAKSWSDYEFWHISLWLFALDEIGGNCIDARERRNHGVLVLSEYWESIN